MNTTTVINKGMPVYVTAGGSAGRATATTTAGAVGVWYGVAAANVAAAAADGLTKFPVWPADVCHTFRVTCRSGFAVAAGYPQTLKGDSLCLVKVGTTGCYLTGPAAGAGPFVKTVKVLDVAPESLGATNLTGAKFIVRGISAATQAQELEV